jgi:hypothetical protein
MTATNDWTITKTIPLDGGVRLKLSFGPAGFAHQWFPARPQRVFTKTENFLYRHTRAAILAGFAEQMGIAPRGRLAA